MVVKSTSGKFTSGKFTAGWYKHPTLGLIKVYDNNGTWVYICYSSSGEKALSRPKNLDQWTWALCEPDTER